MYRNALLKQINATCSPFGATMQKGRVMGGTCGTGWDAALLLQLLQSGEIHAQALLAMFAAKLHFNELGVLLHFAFEDDAFPEGGMTYPVARFELLALRPGRRGWCGPWGWYPRRFRGRA